MRFLIICALLALTLATVLAQVEPLIQYVEDAKGAVVGGEVARPNSWPWQVSLQVRHGRGYSHICGGTLIKRGWVMTAAHCVDSPETWQVVLGEHDLRRSEGHEQSIAVRRAYVHPKWDTNDVGNGYDIALLRLSASATLNRYVKLARLPRSGRVLKHNHTCYISGWGLTSTGGSISTLLKQAYLPVVGYRTCTRYDWWGSFIKKSMVCAGGGSDSGCQGDSGGPLHCPGRCGRYYVHGIVSFGSEVCNAPQKPTIFTRVSYYIRWMRRVIKKNRRS